MLIERVSVGLLNFEKITMFLPPSNRLQSASEAAPKLLPIHDLILPATATSPLTQAADLHVQRNFWNSGSLWLHSISTQEGTIYRQK